MGKEKAALDLTQKQLEKLKGLLNGEADDDCLVEGLFDWQVGKKYFIRTVTHHFTGKLRRVTDAELWFSSVSWIADDGRFSNALKVGKLEEVEPSPGGPVAIGRGSLIDAHLWQHALPRDVV